CERIVGQNSSAVASSQVMAAALAPPAKALLSAGRRAWRRTNSARITGGRMLTSVAAKARPARALSRAVACGESCSTASRTRANELLRGARLRGATYVDQPAPWQTQLLRMQRGTGAEKLAPCARAGESNLKHAACRYRDRIEDLVASHCERVYNSSQDPRLSRFSRTARGAGLSRLRPAK